MYIALELDRMSRINILLFPPVLNGNVQTLILEIVFEFIDLVKGESPSVVPI